MYIYDSYIHYQQYYVHLEKIVPLNQVLDQFQDREKDHNQAGLISSFCPFTSGPGVGDFVSLSRGIWSWIFAISSDAAFWDPSWMSA